MLFCCYADERSDVVEHLAVAGQRPIILTADGLGVVRSGTQSIHCRQHVVVEGNGLLALGGQSLGGIHGILQGVDGIAHGVGVGGELGQGLGLAAHADVLAHSQFGCCGIGKLAHVGVDGRQQLLAGHLQHGQSLDVDDLGVMLHLDLVAALHLHLGQHAELFHQGDVLLAWENEAYLSIKDNPDEYEIVTPSVSILAQPSVAVVDEVVDQRGTRKVATEYLSYLYSDEAQRIAGDNYYRPYNKEILKEYSDVFDLNINLVTINDFGGWDEAQKKHFADGGIFDKIYEKK